jgi:hypothetical protein
VVTLEPATAYLPVTVHATTGAPGSARDVEATRAPLGPGIVVTGTAPPDSTPAEIEVAVRDNTLFFAHVLRETLTESGIRVDGPALDDDARPDTARRPAAPLFVHTSAPMPEVLGAFLKPSQNQYGEILLKTMGRRIRNAGTAQAGLAIEDSLARAWQLPRGGFRPADGSGLSRYNLIAPEHLVALLERMTRSPNYAVFYAAMPVAGVDGTLRNRMKGTPLAGNVHAKTGTLSGVGGRPRGIRHPRQQPHPFRRRRRPPLRSGAAARVQPPAHRHGHDPMSLAPCRECGALVSQAAPACPHCGVPFPATAARVPPARPERGPSRVQLLFGTAAVLAVGIFFGMALIGGDTGDASAAWEDEVLAPPASPVMTPGLYQYGAIAIGREGAYGVSWNAPLPEQAQGRALEECYPGESCRVVLFIAGPMCGAFAQGRTTYAGGLAATRAEAEQRALAECSRDGARSCSVRAWMCNSQP